MTCFSCKDGNVGSPAFDFDVLVSEFNGGNLHVMTLLVLLLDFNGSSGWCCYLFFYLGLFTLLFLTYIMIIASSFSGILEMIVQS